MLLAATAATAAAVAVGMVATGAPVVRDVASYTTAAAPALASADLDPAATAGRTVAAVAVSRSAQRRLAQARVAETRKDLPAYTVLAKPAALERKPPPSSPFTFRIGSLNVLGSQHTRGSKRFAPGVVRTSRAVGMFASRGVDLLGLQEVQDDQLNVLAGRLTGFGIWPGRGLGNNGVRLQIAYRTSLFELVDTGWISTRFAHQSRPIPYVLLENRETKGRFWVVTIHNSPLGQEADRDSATAAEIALFNRLKATGHPVLVTGDMNEKEEWFCKVATGAGMVAANGGSGAGGCSLPPGPLRIDWIMGGGGVAFSGYVQDGASLAGISDHYFIHADVTVTP